MSISQLPLSYCTNVHPGLTVEEVCGGLVEYAGPIQKSLDAPLAAGLWLAQPVIEELLADASNLDLLKQKLADLEQAEDELEALLAKEGFEL